MELKFTSLEEVREFAIETKMFEPVVKAAPKKRTNKKTPETVEPEKTVETPEPEKTVEPTYLPEDKPVAITIDEVVEYVLASEAIADEDRNILADALKPFGVERITHLPAEKLPAFMEAIKAQGA